jgi:hypothetical protein
METVHLGHLDARMQGIAGILAGILIMVLSVALWVMDLPIVGGQVYGSRTQSVTLLIFVGVCCLILGILDLLKKD